MTVEEVKLELRGIIFFVLLVILNCGGCLSSEQKMKVACVGDSITFGARLDNPDIDSYPSQLQGLMGDGYEVTNFGVGGTTLLRKGRPTVWNQLPKIMESSPDIVIISLGTNDTCGMGTCQERKCWDYKGEYPNDYRDLIDTLRTLAKPPIIWICAPSPMVLETPGLSSERVTGLTIRKPRLESLIQIIRSIAKEKNAGFIDLNKPMSQQSQLFTEADGVHPNQKGYRFIAELVFTALNKDLID